jgi:hypothetical protein
MMQRSDRGYWTGADTAGQSALSLPERPDFAAIAAHQRLMNYYGGGLSVEYLDQIVGYALNLEQALMEIRDGSCDDPQARAAEAFWATPIHRRG